MWIWFLLRKWMTDVCGLVKVMVMHCKMCFGDNGVVEVGSVAAVG